MKQFTGSCIKVLLNVVLCAVPRLQCYVTMIAMNNDLSVRSVFCDLQKDFDCVNHNILLEKLEFCGIVGKYHSLTKPQLK